jgi:hypothetical protein
MHGLLIYIDLLSCPAINLHRCYFIDFPRVPRDRNLTEAALFLRFHHIDLKMRMPENCAGMVRLAPCLRS